MGVESTTSGADSRTPCDRLAITSSMHTGEQLGPYEILSPLGAGGMGEVYRAHDKRLGRDVALKILPAEVANDPARRERFEREARALAALNHPNIIAIYDVGEGYIVGELVDGRTLSGDKLSLRQILDIAIQMRPVWQQLMTRASCIAI